MAELTQDQYAILSRYGSGMAVNEIIKQTGQDRETVSSVLLVLTGMARARAATLAKEYADARRPVATPPAKTATKPAADDGIAELLAEAARSGVPRLERAAARINAMLDDLRGLMRAAEQERALRATIATLRSQLDKATAELKGLNGKPATPASTPNGKADRAAIRAWAAERGIDCPVRGRIPVAVVEQYEAAHV